MELPLIFINFFTESFRFIKSQRGRNMLVIAGYNFHRQNVLPHDRARWNCATHRTKECRASAHTYKDFLLKANNEHNHLPKNREWQLQGTNN